MYEIEINEVLSRVIKVEADTPDEALDKVQDSYYLQDIVLDSNDFYGVDFLVKEF